MKTIVFTIRETGHNLEYLHHIYEVCANKPDNDYVFLIPNKAQESMGLFSWEKASNISFDYIPDDFQNKCIHANIIIAAWYMSLYLRKKVLEHHAQHLFVISLISLLPFGGFIIPAQISGIIYSIYLYKWKKSTLLRKSCDVLKFLLLSRTPSFNNVFILNDKYSARYLNRIYRTNKFKFIPDPYIPINNENVWDWRERYNIPKDCFLFAHFGSISKRKGTLDVLKSISMLPDSLRSKFYFVIAGRVFPDFVDEFNSNTKELDSNVIIIKEFCSFDFIANLCRCCNAILLPYLESEQSSGLLGYASQFHVPVIGPSSGLIGKLIKRYNLGILCQEGNPEDLIRCYCCIMENKWKNDSNVYIDQRTVFSFQRVISDTI